MHISFKSKIYDILQGGFWFRIWKIVWVPWSIGVLLSCCFRTVSSFWKLMSLASGSVILELACTNFHLPFSDNITWWRPSPPLIWHCPSDCLVVTIPFHFFYLIQRMPHPQSGTQCLAMWCGRPSWSFLVVFLPSAPLTLLQCAKCMLCTYHIPHNVSWWQSGASHGCPRSWTAVQLQRFSLLLLAALVFHLYPLLDPFLSNY